MNWHHEGTSLDLLSDRVEALIDLGMDREMAHSFCARLIMAGKLCERAAREQDRLRAIRDDGESMRLQDAEQERSRSRRRRTIGAPHVKVGAIR